MPDEIKCRAEDHPPICTDCKYCVEPGFGSFDQYRCARFPNLVNGAPLLCFLIRCGTPHGPAGPCGVEGKYFEPKPMPPKKLNFWKRLLLGQQSTEK